MDNRKKLRPIISVLCVASAAALLAGCDILPGEVERMFEPEPTRPVQSSAEPKDIKTREGAYNSYGYDSLSDSKTLQLDYETLDAYVSKSYSEEFTLNNTSVEDFDRVLEAYENDHPEVFWLDDSSRYSYSDDGGDLTVELNFTVTGDDLGSRKKELDQAAEAAKSGAPASATDYEVEKYINDYIIENCEYVDGADNCHDAYGALVNGKAVCDGYSRAFQLLCNKMDIECVTVEGDAAEFNAKVADESDVGHMWNCVKLDSDWYHVDVTWNDGEARIQRYLYFNLSDEEVKQSHTIFPLYGEAQPGDYLFLNVWLPECSSDEYNYFKRECPTVSNLDDDGDVIAALIVAAENGDEYVDIVVDDSLDYSDVVDSITESYGYNWLSAANYYLEDTKIATDSTFYTYEDVPVVTFVLQYE